MNGLATAVAPRAAPRGLWQRRAKPLLGTLVEVGAPCDIDTAALAAAFAAIAAAQARLSRFESSSVVGRFNATRAPGRIALDADTRALLAAALALRDLSEGLFDITLGSGPRSWSLEGDALVKHRAGVTLDLGGIGKGHAVDLGIRALRAAGCTGGWVNAGGDLRCFGGASLALMLRDETHGGTRPWARLQDGACATSHYAAGSRSALAGRRAATRHLSVVAPRCLWADALTKVAAHDREHPVLTAFGASAVWHACGTDAGAPE